MPRPRSSPPRPAARARTAPTPRPSLPSPVAAFVVCAPGLAPLVADELRALGIADTDADEAGVHFSATLDQLVRCNVWLRCASRIVVRLGASTTRHFGELEALAASLPWGAVLGRDRAVLIRVTARKSRLYHTGAIAERVGQALLRAVPGVYPAVPAEAEEDDDVAAQLVLVRLDRDRCTISVDTSGALLHRRGWRQATAKAPLRETLAAALLASSGWTPSAGLWDPCCGSGTIAIEAALRIGRQAPGAHRGFALTEWPVWAAEARALVAREQQAARDGVQPIPDGVVIASDQDAGAIAAARANAARAGVEAAITFRQVALADAPSVDAGTWIVSNPPYGKRVHAGGSAPPRAATALLGLYRQFAERARRDRCGLALLTDDRALARAAGLEDSPVLHTSNGGLPVAVWQRAPGAR
jgi:putative N6-adenine-specific DNA methylase